MKGSAEEAVARTLSSTKWKYKKVSEKSYVLIAEKDETGGDAKSKLNVSGIVSDAKGEPLIGVTVESEGDKKRL